MDEDVVYLPYDAPFQRNGSADYGLNETNPFHNFDYNTAGEFDVKLYDLLHVFGETWNKDGSLKQRQFRGKGGQYGTNIVSQGKYVHEVAAAMQAVLLPALEQNYDRLVGRGLSSERTGTLRRAVVEGTFLPDEDQLEGRSFVFRLKDLTRTRSRSFTGWKTGATISENSTLRYGPIIFKGRAAIATVNPMVFPTYGAGGRSVVAKTHFVRGTPPADIFDLTAAQISALTMSVMRPLTEIIADQIKTSKSQ